MQFVADRKTVAFFLFESRELSTFPTITNSAVLLARAGFDVDIYLPEHMFCESPGPGVRLIGAGRNDSRVYIQTAMRMARDSGVRYDFYFAAYFEGLAVAALLQTDRPAPVIYLSMELIYRDYGAHLAALLTCAYRTRQVLFVPPAWLAEVSEPIWRRLPEYIRRLARRVRDSQGAGRIRSARYHLKILSSVLDQARDSVIFSIVQDECRETVLRREFDFVNEVIRVPNSYIGFEDRSSDFANRRFDIPAEKRIILYSGAIERGFDGRFFDFLDELSDDGYVLLVNAYSRDGYLDALRPELAEKIGLGRLVLNETLLTDAEYELLVRGSYICLAWYGPPDAGDENMFYLGLSSGKMNRYLACGRPVIVPDYYFGYRELVEKYGFGVACSAVTEFPAAIREIETRYEEFRRKSRDFFERHLEFSMCFQPAIDRLLSGQTEGRVA